VLFAVAEETYQQAHSKMQAFRARHPRPACELRKSSSTASISFCQGCGRLPAPTLPQICSASLAAAVFQLPTEGLNSGGCTQHGAPNWGIPAFTNHFRQKRAKMRFVDHPLAHAIAARIRIQDVDVNGACRRDGVRDVAHGEAELIWCGHRRTTFDSSPHDSVAQFDGTFLRAVQQYPRFMPKQGRREK